MRRRNHALAPDLELLRALRINPRLLRLVIRIGLPTGVQMVVISLAEIVLLSIVNGFGSNATAAYGAVNQVVNYVQFPALSIAITASILGAQSIGAGRAHLLGTITRTGLKMNLVITGSLVLIGYLFSRHLVSAFVTSPPVIELAQTLLHIMLWSSLVFGFQSLLGGDHALQRRGAGAHRHLDLLHRGDRSAVGLVAQPPVRHQRRVDGLSDHLRLHAGAAGELLPAGLAQAQDRAAGLTPAASRAERQ